MTQGAAYRLFAEPWTSKMAQNHVATRQNVETS